MSGSILPGVVSAEIENNNHFASDRFRLQFAAGVVQSELLHIPGAQVEIEVGLDDEWLTGIIGEIDSVSLDPTRGMVSVEGRDLSSQLIESQTDEMFANRTSSEIAILFGSRHGLVVLADPTTTPIGRYYQSEHDRITLSQFSKTMSEWDLLALLAVREGFDLFMVGRVLRFGLPVTTAAQIINVSDCININLGHCVSLARPIDVLVKSWNSKTGASVTGHALSGGTGVVWERRITRPNLSSDDAQGQAQRIVQDLKRHEWTASVVMPGDLTLTARSLVAIQGTTSQWDRAYNVSQISRQLDVKRGFIQTVALQGLA